MHRARLAALAMTVGAALAACNPEREVRAPDVEDHAKARRVEAATERTIERAGAVFDDATVTAKVKTALIAEPGLRALAIDVDTRDNVVTLSGTVASAALREDAGRVTSKVTGVKQVRNDLAIKTGR